MQEPVTLSELSGLVSAHLDEQESFIVLGKVDRWVLCVDPRSTKDRVAIQRTRSIQTEHRCLVLHCPCCHEGVPRFERLISAVCAAVEDDIGLMIEHESSGEFWESHVVTDDRSKPKATALKDKQRVARMREEC